MSDAQLLPSTTEPTADPNQGGLDIASLCNPMNEIADIRQPQASSLFDKNLDAIHKPFRIKDHSCEQYFLPRRYHYLNVHLAEIELFLSGLTEDSIDRAIACFQDGLHSHKVLISHFDSRRAQNACHSILRMTERGSTAMSMVYNIPKFWINLKGLVQASNLTALETTMTCAFCMKGALKFHFWLLDVIPTAIERISKPSYIPKIWIDKLVTYVQSSLHKRSSATFLSSDYLPDLAFHYEYKMEAKPFKFKDADLLISVTSSIIRCWLSFPADQYSLAQLTLLDIMTSKSPTSIFFLDNIWEMYKTPFITVFHNWDLSRSKIKLTQALTNFEKQFSLHPFADLSSLSYRKHLFLSELVQEWTETIGAGVNLNAEIVSHFIDLTDIYLDFLVAHTESSHCDKPKQPVGFILQSAFIFSIGCE